MATSAAHSSHAARVDRRETARQLLQKELDQLPPEERNVVERFISRRQVARNVVREFRETRSLGERVADKVASVGGSWRFIICFGVVLVIWMLVNSAVLAKAFDPYPYILLNLVLSCLAAVQAPIIMMSQNRQAAVDRMHAENDYQVNIKSELEVLQIHEKLDLLRSQDWAQLVEQQNRQIAMLQRLLEQTMRMNDRNPD
ncbi:cyclic nucleotide-binding protein [Stenotrophomonas pictorum JCM 9942]|jgi:uncharacterized membrane protein|uniref:Cyclic nucleotide-binding protein n=1 Tax=Stenotrophomonas pictorum JCM 9942 TaxID=1236960 RepID=A0A0R0AC70_9GAMM|nr:DUF1003 domain-containing protein [Stenotrophomonas pictorum]KRG42508.1 cyclic nucleotide-binding protein [Stenotrophomonas pictorum JCM 9942]